MKIVLYTSSTGFTKQYAECIAERLKCEVKPRKKVKDFSQYDTVIYGGWIMGGMIMGLSSLMKSYHGNIIVFAVGSSRPNETLLNNMKTQNHLDQIPLFYMMGGMNFAKLGFFKKVMLSVIKKSIAKKEVKSEDDLHMEKTLSRSCDCSDQSQIDPLISYVQTQNDE